MADTPHIPNETKTRAQCCRHAELVSASIQTRSQPVVASQWTLKQVQGDGVFWNG
jgi:hypothetical protein